LHPKNSNYSKKVQFFWVEKTTKLLGGGGEQTKNLNYIYLSNPWKSLLLGSSSKTQISVGLI
jgi:hypothetical protein